MKYVFIGLLSAFLFGLSTPLSKMIVGSVDPLPLASLYYLASAFILLPFSFKHLKKEWFQFIQYRRDIFLLSGSFVLGGMIAPISLLYGIRLTSATSASLLLNLETVATAILAYFFFKEQLTKKDWLGALGIVAAGCLLVFEKGWILNRGSLFIVFSCICWGMDNNCTANIRTLSPVSNAFLKGSIAGIFNFILSIITTSSWPRTSSDLLGILLIGMFSFGVSIALYIICARKIGAFHSQILFATSPFWGVGFSLLLLKEPFIFQQALASILCISSLLLIFKRF